MRKENIHTNQIVVTTQWVSTAGPLLPAGTELQVKYPPPSHRVGEDFIAIRADRSTDYPYTVPASAVEPA